MAGNRNSHDKSGRLKIDRLVIVEGKYDKIKIETLIDAEIISTEGFGIYKDEEKKNYIRECASKRGILILTDSDRAGFRIRNYIRDFAGDDNIINCYIPEIKGKEKRKSVPSAEGTLGVEGIPADIIFEEIKASGAEADIEYKYQFTSADMYELGLIGHSDSKEKRNKLKKILSLPAGMNNKLLMKALSKKLSREELKDIAKSI